MTDFPIRGAYYRGQEVLDLIDTFEENTELTLEREPENEYDPFAIKILYEGIHLGYVPKEMAAYLDLDEVGTTCYYSTETKQCFLP